MQADIFLPADRPFRFRGLRPHARTTPHRSRRARVSRAPLSELEDAAGCRHGRRERAIWSSGFILRRGSIHRARSSRRRPSPSSFRTRRRAAGISCRNRARPRSAPAYMWNALRMRVATICGVSTVLSARSMTPRMICFDGRSLSTARSSFGCAASIETCCALRLLEFGQERIAGRLFVHDRRITETQMHGDGAGDAFERAVERLHAVAPRLLGMLLHPGLVDLHDVGAGREQILDLGIERHRESIASASSSR